MQQRMECIFITRWNWLKIPSTVYVEINDRPDYHGIGQKNWNTETANYI